MALSLVFNVFTGTFDYVDINNTNIAFDASLILTMPAQPAFAAMGWEILFDMNGNVLTKDP